MKKGRKKIGPPISVTVTPEQRRWLNTQIPMGGTLTQVIRKIIEDAMTCVEYQALKKGK